MTQFDYFTRITKEEHLTNIDHNIIPNTLVLEMSKPFPAYYGGQFLTSNSTPGTILLVLKEAIDFEDFYRAVNNIKEYCEYPFNAALTKIYVYNLELSAIRLRDLSEFTHIKEIQSSFMNENIDMAKPKTFDTKALIKISKFIQLSEEEEGLYRDLENEHFSFFKVPYKLNWKQFEMITNKVRHNMDSKAYDVAKGVFYTKDGMIDFIRVYTEKISAAELKSIQSKYLKHYHRL